VGKQRARWIRRSGRYVTALFLLCNISRSLCISFYDSQWANSQFPLMRCCPLQKKRRRHQDPQNLRRRSGTKISVQSKGRGDVAGHCRERWVDRVGSTAGRRADANAPAPPRKRSVEYGRERSGAARAVHTACRAPLFTHTHTHTHKHARTTHQQEGSNNPFSNDTFFGECSRPASAKSMTHPYRPHQRQDRQKALPKWQPNGIKMAPKRYPKMAPKRTAVHPAATRGAPR